MLLTRTADTIESWPAVANGVAAMMLSVVGEHENVMKKVLTRLNVVLVISGLWITGGLPLRGQSIFDNSVNDLLTRFNPGTAEVGDQIIVSNPSNQKLTWFDFEYWGTNTASLSSFAGTVQARVRFYENNGNLFNGYAAPGTNFFDSGWFSVPAPTSRSTFVFLADGSDFPIGGLTLPSTNFTWTVQFQGMGATDSVGVDIYSPPGVGQDYPDYWQYNGGWQLMTNSIPMDFGARMYVPEPSAVLLSLLGGAGLLAALHRARRKS